MQYLKKDTQVSVLIGPILDDTDFKTPEVVAYNAAGIDVDVIKGVTKIDVNLILAPGNGYWAHVVGGYHLLTLSASDTNTVGPLRVRFSATGCLPVWEDFIVLPANIYDFLFVGNVLSLQQLSLINPNGDALIAQAGTSGHGINAIGAGALPGFKATGGTTGAGAVFSGGATGGQGIRADATGGFSGIQATGEGTGAGIRAQGGATGGAGLYAYGGTDGRGIHALGQGTGAGIQSQGGANGIGLFALGGATSGHGLRAQAGTGSGGSGFVTNGDGVGHGFSSAGGATGHGMKLQGGSTSGHGMSLDATAGNGLRARGVGGFSGAMFLGVNSGSHGLELQGVAGGAGLLATGGATGDGIKTVPGTGGAGINGNLSGSVGSVIDQTAITAVQNTVNGISNVTRLTTAFPGYFTRPAAGSMAVRMEFALKDMNGSMEDPDNDELMLNLYNFDPTQNINSHLYKDRAMTTGLDLASAEGYRKLERSDVGMYYAYCKVSATDELDEIIARVQWLEGGTPNYELRGFQIVDYTNDLAAIEAKVDALHNFDPATDTVARVALVDEVTLNRDMRGTDGAITDLSPAINAVTSLHDFDPATDPVARVTLVDTTTTLTNSLVVDNEAIAGAVSAELAATLDIPAIEVQQIADRVVGMITQQMSLSNALSIGPGVGSIRFEDVLTGQRDLPVADAIVRAYPYDPQTMTIQWDNCNGSCTTNALGQYHLNLDPGTYARRIWKNGVVVLDDLMTIPAP